MSLIKDKYAIAYAALKNLDKIINYNLENIEKYVQELEKKETVEVDIYNNQIIVSKLLKQWTCPKCRKYILAMEIKIKEYNFCPHCGVSLEWVEG